MAPNCSSLDCTQPGALRCGACKTTQYCSKACQKTHWKTHKLNCTAKLTYNCFVIRAAPASEAGQVLNNISAQIEPLHLENYGNERAEKQELTDKLGLRQVVEAGKFYDHIGSDHWYYYVYGDVSLPKKSSPRPRNEIGDLICYKQVYGDIAVVRSGPAGAAYPTSFTQHELCKAVEFYKTEDRASVFLKREESRFCRKLGVNHESLPRHVYYNSADNSDRVTKPCVK